MGWVGQHLGQKVSREDGSMNLYMDADWPDSGAGPTRRVLRPLH